MKKSLIIIAVTLVTFLSLGASHSYAQPCLQPSNLLCSQRRANNAFVCEDNGLRCLDDPRAGQTGSCCFATPAPAPTDAAGVPVDIGGAAGAIGKVIPPAPVDATPNAVNNYIPTLLNLAFFIGLVALLAYLVYGAIKWITAGGDVKALQSARDTITHAILGVILLSIGLAVAQVFDTMLKTPSGPQFPTNNTTFTYYVCGFCPQNLSNGVCEEESLHQCDNPITVPIDSLTSTQKASLCTTTTSCRQGCIANHNYNPREYRNCRPPQ